MDSATLTLKASQFDNLEYAVFFHNTLTKTEILQPNRVKIIEFLTEGLVLQLPAKLCAEGHLLVLDIFPRGTKKSLTELKRDPTAKDLMNFTCKVKLLEKEGNIGDRVTVEFYQIDKNAWEKFLKSYAKRQDELDQLIKAMRDE